MDEKVQLKYLRSPTLHDVKLIIYLYRREAGILIIGRVGLLQLRLVGPDLQGVLGGPEGALPGEQAGGLTPLPLLQSVNYLTTESTLVTPHKKNVHFCFHVM